MSNQPSWPPFQPTKDCSLGICSIYCPRWCYSLFPPPPPFFETDEDDTAPSLSPLAIALIALAATALILVGYYTVICRFCRRWHHPTTTAAAAAAAIEDETATATTAGWQGSPQGGLDDALINKITICRYKKADGLVGGANCSVCLSEFREDEGLRLLPKCSHAFHVQCIDTWLKSHPNCPLCRAGIVWTSPPAVPMPPSSSSERNRSGHQMNDPEIAVHGSGSDEQIPKDPVPDASENSIGGGGGEGSQLSGSAGSSMSDSGDQSGVLSV